MGNSFTTILICYAETIYWLYCRQKLLDSNGRGLVKVCEDEDKDDEDAKNELLDLQAVDRPSQLSKSATSAKALGSSDFPTHSPKIAQSQQNATFMGPKDKQKKPQ